MCSHRQENKTFFKSILNSSNEMKVNNVKPFVKWAGGKSRLLKHLSTVLPEDLGNGKIERYIESCIGGGSLFFYIAKNYKIKEFIINDNNFSLISAYITIQKDVDTLIKKLKGIERKYLSLNNFDDKKKFYYLRRTKFNILKRGLENEKYNSSYVDFTSLFIFLNKTCYNGIFRLNSKGEFNVPIGSDRNPKIFDEENLRNVNFLLKSAKIMNEDFAKVMEKAKDNSFIYIDPPYSLKKNNGFLSYDKKIFDWDDQIRLQKMVNDLVENNNIKIMMSNANNNDIKKFYPNFYKSEFSRASSIGGTPSSRKNFDELVLTSYKTSSSYLI